MSDREYMTHDEPDYSATKEEMEEFIPEERTDKKPSFVCMGGQSGFGWCKTPCQFCLNYVKEAK